MKVLNFYETLTNDIVSFEQRGPEQQFMLTISDIPKLVLISYMFMYVYMYVTWNKICLNQVTWVWNVELLVIFVEFFL